MSNTSKFEIHSLARTCKPRLRNDVIRRAISAEVFKASRCNKCVLISAPVGYGKTTVLSQVHEQWLAEEVPATWLSLSASDSDPRRLLAGIAHSIQKESRNTGAVTLSLLEGGMAISEEAIATTLMNEILAYDKEIVLCIDEVEYASTGRCAELLRALVVSSPPNLSLVLASRVTPREFNDLRLRGQIKEFGVDHLRLNLNEAQALIANQKVLCADPEYAETLLERVDGWINGFHIATELLRESRDPLRYMTQLSGDNPDISSFIDNSVFCLLDDDLKDFLIKTSILEVLTPSLCDFVTDQDNGLRLLEEVRRLNIFVVDYDRERRCYRYNRCFREFLLNKIDNLSETSFKDVHRKAYKGFISWGMSEPAVSHMVKAEDYEVAAEYIESQLEQLLSNYRLSEATRLLSFLPENIVAKYPMLLIIKAWVAALTRKHSTARDLISQATSIVEKNGDSTEELFEDNIRILECVLAVVSCNSAALAELAAGPDKEYREDQRFYRQTYACCQVYANLYTGNYDKAHRLGATGFSKEDTNFTALVYMHIFRGIGYIKCGHLQNALDELRRALNEANSRFGATNKALSAPRALIAAIYFEWDRLGEAEAWLQKPSLVKAESSVVEPIVENYRVMARLKADAGEYQAALNILAEGEALGHAESSCTVIVQMLCERFRLLKAAGNLIEAKSICNELKNYYVSWKHENNNKYDRYWIEENAEIDLVNAEFLVAISEFDEAFKLLEQNVLLARSFGKSNYLVKALLLKSLCLSNLGKRRQSTASVSEALEIAASGNLLRTIYEFGKAHKSLIEPSVLLLQAERKEEYVMEFLGRVKTRLDLNVSLSDEALDPALIEDITPREFELLRLLETGLKNREIAERLNVSSHTIAWHLKNLYGKLQVENRTAAVSVFRQLKHPAK